MNSMRRIATVFLLLGLAVFTVAAAPSEQEAVEAYALANLAYTSSMTSASAGNVPGVTFSMTASGMEYSFEKFDLSSLDIDPGVQVLLAGNNYKTVSGKLVVETTGKITAKFTLTGGPVTKLNYTYEGGTVNITADDAKFTY